MTSRESLDIPLLFKLYVEISLCLYLLLDIAFENQISENIDIERKFDVVP